MKILEISFKSQQQKLVFMWQDILEIKVLALKCEELEGQHNLTPSEIEIMIIF